MGNCWEYPRQPGIDGGASDFVKKEVIICDRCKKEKPCEIVFEKTGRNCDAAGSMEDIGVYWDICHTCAAKWLMDVLNNHGEIDSENWRKEKKQ